MRNIALIGKARSGKDSAAAHLVRTHAYMRLAFADQLKETALRANPIIGCDLYAGGPDTGYEPDVFTTRLSEIVAVVGWERAKEEPEVRRFLQDFGQAMREVDEDIWLRPVMSQIDSAEWLNMPVVLTDVRYYNEAEDMARRGFLIVRIVRPGTGADAHISETEMDAYRDDHVIHNNGTLDDLAAKLDALPLD